MSPFMTPSPIFLVKINKVKNLPMIAVLGLKTPSENEC
jgi:hypothetical protein